MFVKVPTQLLAIAIAGIISSGCSQDTGEDERAAISRSIPETEGLITTRTNMPETLTLDMVERSEARVDLGFEPTAVRTDFRTVEAEVSYDDTYLIVTSKGVNRERMGRIEILSGKKVAAYASIRIENTSSESLLKKADALDAQAKDLLKLHEAQKLYRYYVDVAHEGGQISDTQKTELLESFAPTSVSSYPETATVLSDVYATVNAYRGGALPERDLVQAIKKAEEQLDKHASMAVEHFERLSEHRPATPDFSRLSFVYRPKQQDYRMFHGNPLFGSIEEDGGFVFHREYQDLVGFTFYEEKQSFWDIFGRLGL